MKKYRDILKKRLALASLYNAVVLILLALGIFHMTTGSNAHVKDYISGFNLGFCVGVQIVMLFFMGKYYSALKNDGQLKKLYIAENDERGKFIRAQIGGAGINIVICGLAVGTIISGYFNETVFFTLMGTMLFTALVKLVLKLIYSKKF